MSHRILTGFEKDPHQLVVIYTTLGTSGNLLVDPFWTSGYRVTLRV